PSPPRETMDTTPSVPTEHVIGRPHGSMKRADNGGGHLSHPPPRDAERRTPWRPATSPTCTAQNSSLDSPNRTHPAPHPTNKKRSGGAGAFRMLPQKSIMNLLSCKSSRCPVVSCPTRVAAAPAARRCGTWVALRTGDRLVMGRRFAALK